VVDVSTADAKSSPVREGGPRTVEAGSREPAVANEPVSAGVESDSPDPGVCALEGCDLPLPVRPLDELGRPRAGRRPQYCGKAHADAASRQRRARDVAAVADPLTLAREAGQVFLPTARQLAAQLADLITHVDRAEAGALARVGAAEEEAARAGAEAAAARDASEAAEQGRRQALATARQDRQARDNAVKEAERARQEAEQIRSQAWEQVAAHERGRGQAEAARVAAESVSDDLAGQNRQLREQVDLARSTVAELTARIAADGQDLERARGEGLALAARAEAVEQLKNQEIAALREHLARLEERAAVLQTHAEQAGEQARSLAQEADRRQQQVTALEERSATLQTTTAAIEAELAAGRLAHQHDQRLLAEAREQIRARDRRQHKLRRAAQRSAGPNSTSTPD